MFFWTYLMIYCEKNIQAIIYKFTLILKYMYIFCLKYLFNQIVLVIMSHWANWMHILCCLQVKGLHMTDIIIQMMKVSCSYLVMFSINGGRCLVVTSKLSMRNPTSVCHLKHRKHIIHCDSIITRSYTMQTPLKRGHCMAPKYFSSIVCENVSKRRGTTQCKLWNTYSLCIS